MKWYNDLFKGKGLPSGQQTTLGVGSTQIYGGYINSNEKNTKLRGSTKYLTYGDILANTSIVAAGTRYFLNLVSKAEWKFDCDEGSDNEEIVEKLEQIRYHQNTPWFRQVRRTAMYRFYGFSFQEWTAKLLDDGTVGYLDVQARPQHTIERWMMNENNIVDGVWQRSPQDGKEIFLPRNKLIYAIDDAISDSPEGLGLFRHIVESARRLNYYETYEGQGFETDLRGIPIGRAPLALFTKMVKEGKLTAEQKTQIEAGMTSFMENHIRGKSTSVLLDSSTYMSSDEAQTPSGNKMWDVELMQGGTNSLDAVDKAITRLNYEIARVLGVEGLLVGGADGGSLALSRDKTNNLFLLVDSTLKEIADIYEKDWLRPLFLMNGWDEKMMPRMKTESIQMRDVEQITAALRDMATAGAVLSPDDPAINEVRDLCGLSHQKEVDMDLDASLYDEDDAPFDPNAKEEVEEEKV